MLSFEEFQAVNARQKSKELLKEQLNSKNDSKSTGAKTIKGDKAASAAPPGPSSKDGSSRTTFSTMSFGDFLELNQLQILIVVLILLDSFAAMVEIYIRSLQLEMLENADVTAAFQAFTTLSVKIVTGALHAFAQFNLLMFALEILAILVAFNVSLVGHLGYTLDILVISAQIYMETFKGLGRETRILNVFRLWRLFRLLNSLIEIETSKHEVTKGELQKKVDAVQRFETDIARMEGDLKSERQVRASVETMLQGYKEEVDTLNEALRIAAMDIAEVRYLCLAIHYFSHLICRSIAMDSIFSSIDRLGH
jgi:hypothetical protein